MRKTTLLYAPILACMALFALVFSAWADVALPPPLWIQPYDEEQTASISSRLAGTEWVIFFITPGHCEYTCTVYGPDSDTIAAASASGSLEKFGPQAAMLPVPLKAIEKGKTARYRLLASGNYYRYKKIPADGKKKGQSSLNDFVTIMGDPNYRYELIDKKGEPFTLEKTFAITCEQDGSYSIASTPAPNEVR